MNGLKRTLVKKLLKSSKIVDGSELAGFFMYSPAVRSMSSDLRNLVGEDMTKWEGGPERTSVSDTVKRLCREVDNVNVGFEGARFLQIFANIVQVPPERIFNLGDVVRHKLFDEVGVVLGIHESCAMPPSWCNQNLGTSDHPLIKETWYDILLDEKHGGFKRHGANRFHERVKVPVEHSIIKMMKWEFDEKTGTYSSTEETDPPSV